VSSNESGMIEKPWKTERPKYGVGTDAPAKGIEGKALPFESI